MNAPKSTLKIHFTDFFHVAPKTLAAHGAFNISLINDLPLFIDPFLLFNSDDPAYQVLHDGIIKYLRFLRDLSVRGTLSKGALKAWFMFPEVKQAWLGFSKEGNCGSGLGLDFAQALHLNLHTLLVNFGDERIARGSHLEKLCLIKEGVGRDNISDFTAHLILDFLATYTQRFAHGHLSKKQCNRFTIRNAKFNYQTGTWQAQSYDLPSYCGDYILLTPENILTKDENWINRQDMLRRSQSIAKSVNDAALREQLNTYLQQTLSPEMTSKERHEIFARLIQQNPQLMEYYILDREEHGDEAIELSEQHVDQVRRMFINEVRFLAAKLQTTTRFYNILGNTLEESRERLLYLKDVIENKGGHRIFYSNGEPIRREHDIHTLFRLTWYATPSDVSAEANDGRGPVDFKVSRGAYDKTLVEFKLASNPQLKRNLQKQVEIYQKASDAPHALKAIIFFTEEEYLHTISILNELEMQKNDYIYLIDAREDNKPSGSKA